MTNRKIPSAQTLARHIDEAAHYIEVQLQDLMNSECQEKFADRMERVQTLLTRHRNQIARLIVREEGKSK